MTTPDTPTDTAPPSRGHLATEQRLAAAAAIDAQPIEATLRLMNTQDMQVPQAVRQAIPAMTALVEDIVDGLRAGGRLLYCGAGTSGRLGVLDASECPPTFCSDPGQVVGFIAGGDGALRVAAEGAEDDPQGAHATIDGLELNEHDTLIGIAAGGTTPYVWGAIRRAGERGAVTAIMTCVPIHTLKTRPRAAVVKGNQPLSLPPSPKLPAEVDHRIELLVGPEVITGSTRLKAGTATKLALNMISTTAMLQLGKAWGNLMVDLHASNAKLVDRSIRIVTSQTGLSREDAADAIDNAGGSVKLALIMVLRDVDRDTAQQLLDQHNQKLRPILGPPK
ncbi:MAG: N-acetylmuramic acid 6-phosphate etherase [Phycisphaerales bacterium JB063]